MVCSSTSVPRSLSSYCIQVVLFNIVQNSWYSTVARDKKEWEMWRWSLIPSCVTSGLVCSPSSGQLQRLILSLLKTPNNIQLLLWSIVPLPVSARKHLKRKQTRRKKMSVTWSPQQHVLMMWARWLLRSRCLLLGRLRAVKVSLTARG